MSAASPVLRVARASADIKALHRFYVDGLGLEVLAQFIDHDGFDGLIVGAAEAPYHFEFTEEHGVAAPSAPGPESLLVFYLPEAAAFDAALARMRAVGAREVPAHNPYWDRVGVTFEDPDGYRVVLQQAAWTL